MDIYIYLFVELNNNRSFYTKGVMLLIGPSSIEL